MSELAFRFVEIERHDDVAVLVVSDPPANTLTYDLVLQLEDAFFALSFEQDLRAIVLTGAGERFYSGGVNIGMLRNVSPHYNSNFLLYAAEVFELISKSRLPVVAAINGHVTGGGLELALIARRRIAIEGTYNLGFPEVRLGVIPGLGGTQRLARLIGAQRALDLIVHGDFIPVGHAKDLGIVDAVLPKRDFLRAVIGIARLEARQASEARQRPVPQTNWQRPSDALIDYRREGGVGIIKLMQECSEATALQVLWALNRAILTARSDDGAESLLITHEGERLLIGAAASVDEHTREYAKFVFDRIKNTPRLCALAAGGALEGLAAELARSCDLQRSQPEALEPSLDSVLGWMARFVSPRGASKAIGYAKLAVVQGSSMPLEAGMLLERHLQEQLFRGLDAPEGMRAYLEKRTAVFKGE